MSRMIVSAQVLLHVLPKEPYPLAKEPYFLIKESYFLAKELCVLTEKHYLFTKRAFKNSKHFVFLSVCLSVCLQGVVNVPVPGVPLAATVHLAPRNLVCELSTLLAPFFHRRTSALDLRVAGSFLLLC